MSRRWTASVLAALAVLTGLVVLPGWLERRPAVVAGAAGLSGEQHRAPRVDDTAGDAPARDGDVHALLLSQRPAQRPA